ncbi:hypothetical protein GGR56DRAFT_652336 [Xylariaceae sp. FL0804]|nr:hypothetical protein GGR56DRAFT_652336 [Xylariaceae sp. FL0804]
MSRAMIRTAGVVAVGGVGYYLYTAGGEPKVAQKQAEADLHSVSARVKSDLPGSAKSRGKEAEKEAEKFGALAGAKADSAYAKTQSELQRAEEYAKETKDAAMKKINETDKKVEAKAAEAKSGISSWFGGK